MNQPLDPAPTVLNQLTGNRNADTPEASSADPLPNSAMSNQYGAYGNRMFAGYVSGEEYNIDLQGWNGIRIYDEMRRSDATVQASLKLLNLPLMGADWRVEAGGEDDEDQMIAAFVEHNIFKLLKWRYFLSEALLCLPFGYSVFEKVFKWIDWDGFDGKGKGRYIGIDKLASRKQDTILAWQTADGEPGVQQVTPSGGMYSIPASKLMIFTHQREGNNFEGISVLRSSYKHYYVKSQLEKIMTIAAERQGSGIPFFEAPTNATDDQLQKARNVMKNIRANEQSYMEMPSGWVYGFTDMHANGNYDPMPQVHYHNRQILLNVLGQHLDMGSSGASGSRATSQNHNQILDQSIESLATVVIEDVINENLIKQLVDANFNTDKYPYLTHSPIADDSSTTLPDAIQKFVSSGVVTPDADIEEWIREIFNMPEMTQEIRDNYDKKIEQAGKMMDMGGLPGMPGDPNAAGNPGKASDAKPGPGQPADKPGSQSKNDEKINDKATVDDIKAHDVEVARLQLIKASDALYAQLKAAD